MKRRPTTQDISWFLDLHRNNQLDLDPSYQRRSVWTPKDKKFFLDTIFRNYPCPSIFLHKTIENDGKQVYHVVDGKQRLETVIAFVQNKVTIGKDFGNAELDGKKWKDFESAIEWRKHFWDYVFTVEMLDTVEGTVVNEVFDRLNRNSRKLERQELRHAKYDGWFISIVESESEKQEWREIGVVTTARAKRMKDVQFISELFIALLTKSVRGFDQDFIDDMYARYDDPAANLTNFSEEDFLGEVEKVKDYIIEVDKCSRGVQEYARGFGNFYSLWCLVALCLNRLPDAATFSADYVDFMKKVAFLGEIEASNILEIEMQKDQYEEPGRYLKATLGANTEESARSQRHSALINALAAKK